MAKGALYLENTSVPASKTIGDITGLLVRFGARSIETVYESGKPVGLCWSMMLYDRAHYFKMPAKTTPVFTVLRKRRIARMNAAHVDLLREQAERVAWRQMLAWVQVQLSLVELGMVEYAETFLPYAQESAGGRTMWEAARETWFKAIEGPKQ